MKYTNEEIKKYHYDALINIIKNDKNKSKHIDKWKQIAHDYFISDFDAEKISGKYSISIEKANENISIMNTFTFFNYSDDAIVNDAVSMMIHNEKGDLIGFETCDFINKQTVGNVDHYIIRLIEHKDGDVSTYFKYNHDLGWEPKNMTEAQILTDIKNIILDFFNDDKEE